MSDLKKKGGHTICVHCLQYLPSLIDYSSASGTEIREILDEFKKDNKPFVETHTYGLIQLDALNGVLHLTDNISRYDNNFFDLSKLQEISFGVKNLYMKNNNIYADITVSMLFQAPFFIIRDFTVKKNVKCKKNPNNNTEITMPEPALLMQREILNIRNGCLTKINDKVDEIIEKAKVALYLYGDRFSVEDIEQRRNMLLSMFNEESVGEDFKEYHQLINNYATLLIQTIDKGYDE